MASEALYLRLFVPLLISYLLASVRGAAVNVTLKADDTLLLLMRRLGRLSAATQSYEAQSTTAGFHSVSVHLLRINSQFHVCG